VLIVNDAFELRGLATVKDIVKNTEHPAACKDSHGQLLVGAAVGVGDGTEERVAKLVAAGVDVLVVDTAHGHSSGVIERVRWIKAHYPKVEVIDEYFVGDRYQEQLSKTDVLLLPYGKDYRLRVSRVVIEALAQGKPFVVGSGTTLEDQGREFGASVAFDNKSVDSLVQALQAAVANFAQLDQRARHQAPAAREHFSVATFRNILLSH
jgi:glycosyltransferase involved in cell wall biosynthesis